MRGSLHCATVGSSARTLRISDGYRLRISGNLTEWTALPALLSPGPPLVPRLVPLPSRASGTKAFALGRAKSRFYAAATKQERGRNANGGGRVYAPVRAERRLTSSVEHVRGSERLIIRFPVTELHNSYAIIVTRCTM